MRETAPKSAKIFWNGSIAQARERGEPVVRSAVPPENGRRIPGRDVPAAAQKTLRGEEVIITLGGQLLRLPRKTPW